MRGKKPIKEGEIIEVDVISTGKSGDGVGYIGETHFVVFIKGARKGEKVKARIQNISKNSAYAEVCQ